MTKSFTRLLCSSFVQVYNEYGKRDKDRYRRELQEYRERMRLVQPRGVLRLMEPVREAEVCEGGAEIRGS